MKYKVTRLRPNGEIVESFDESLRKAGQRVFYCLYDNDYATKKEATQLAMECEKTGRIEVGSLWWTIERV